MNHKEQSDMCRIEKIKLEGLSYNEIKDYVDKLEQMQNQLRSRIAKANRILMIKSINTKRDEQK